MSPDDCRMCEASVALQEPHRAKTIATIARELMENSHNVCQSHNSHLCTNGTAYLIVSVELSPHPHVLECTPNSPATSAGDPQQPHKLTMTRHLPYLLPDVFAVRRTADNPVWISKFWQNILPGCDYEATGSYRDTTING